MSDATIAAAQTSATARRAPDRISTAALWAASIVLFAGTTVLMFQRGGFESDDQLRAAAVAFAVLGVLALTAPWPLVRSRAGLGALAALAGLAVWTGASIAWARIEIVAANDGARVALYAAAFAAALIAMRSPAVRRATPWALLAGICAATVYGLGTRLLPGLFEAEVFGNAGSRLAHPITYWNGLGLLTGAGLLLGVACASERVAAPRGLRALGCALAVPCGLACYLTLSRGALAAVAAGLAVLVLTRPRSSTVVAAACAVVPVGALVGAVQVLGDVKAAPRFPPAQYAQGNLMAALVVAAAVCAGVAFALVAPRVEHRRLPWRPSARLAAPLAVATVAAFAVATVAISYASEQEADLPATGARVTETKTFRGPYWDVALAAWADHPVLGVGSGSFRVEWRRENVVPRGAADAHSLYFETLGELGVVGGLLLAAFLVAVARGLVGAARAVPGDPLLPAAAAVLAAYAVHLGVDWDWELPGVMLPALLLAAAALTRPERRVGGGVRR